jgi:hypothetical protein
VAGQALHDELHGGLLMAQREAEVAGHGAREKFHVLDVERLIEAELVAQRGQLVHGGIAGEHGRRGSPDKRRAAKTSVTTPNATSAVWNSL